MVEAILKDKRRILPCCAFCDTEYGIGGYFVGVPVLLSREGVERVIELQLNDEEKAMLQESIDHVKILVAEIEAM
jgi:malate dehydrogenase